MISFPPSYCTAAPVAKGRECHSVATLSSGLIPSLPLHISTPCWLQTLVPTSWKSSDSPKPSSNTYLFFSISLCVDLKEKEQIINSCLTGHTTISINMPALENIPWKTANLGGFQSHLVAWEQ